MVKVNFEYASGILEGFALRQGMISLGSRETRGLM